MSRLTASRAALLGAATLCLLSACGRGTPPPPAEGGAEVSASTAKANADMAAALNLADPRDLENARRGLIARPQGRILGPGGEVLVDFDAFRFTEGPAPATVNPSLWRHAQLNAQIGLFKVTDGIWQLRGFDIANMTLIEGRSGWIVVDPLTARETAAAALAFARQHLGDKPVSALIYTHSHVDHFGGAQGVISPQEATARRLPIVAPAGFIEEATSENVMVGTAMGRRSGYQFGKDLARSARGMVDTGLGKTLAYGTLGLIAPTQLIEQPEQALELDGVRFVFHNTPSAEAPAELTFSIPSLKAYGGAELLAQTMHNLLPVRGAKVRDALRWSQYLDQALQHAAGAEVCFNQHNWPVWGAAQIAEFIGYQRDLYKFMHDQTVRLTNAGLTPREIAERIKLPPTLAAYFGTRGYYGDLRHNVKAVYQHYLGAYDGNPAQLNPLPPVEAGRRYVELAGGADKLLAAGQAAFDRGDYRWAAELLNHLVMADSRHDAARELLARSHEQMAYAAESATWRNSYLTAAQELRQGPPKQGVTRANVIDVLNQTPIERFLEAMAASLDADKAEGKALKVNLVLSDTGERYRLEIANSVMHHRRGEPDPAANATLTLTKAIFVKMMAGTAGLKDTLLSDDLQVQGSRIDLVRFFSMLDKAPGTFPIVTR